MFFCNLRSAEGNPDEDVVISLSESSDVVTAVGTWVGISTEFCAVDIPAHVCSFDTPVGDCDGL